MSHGGPLPIVYGTCMHGEIECTTARHATCRHCGREIIVIQSWGTQTWQHKGSNGGSSYVSCPTTMAAPEQIVEIETQIAEDGA